MKENSGFETLAAGTTYSFASFCGLGSICRAYDASGNLKFSATYDPWGKQTVSTKTLDLRRGYTGHEHWNEFGLIDMNGRFYDPVVGRFLSPDPYVQDPSTPQNFNRYSYCLNNPLKYTDPSGKFWHIVIGAVVGGVINWATHGCDFTWEGCAYFNIGALAGAASAAIGGGVSSAMAGGSFWAGAGGTAAAATATSSFASGAAIGASSGAVAGSISESCNAWLDGASFKQGAWKGFVSGNVGALTGGLLGGIVGGIDAYKQSISFQKGCDNLGINASGPVPATDEFLNNAQQTWYPNAPMESVNKFTVENIPANVQNSMNANGANACTKALSIKGVLTGKSNVYFNTSAFSSAKQLFYTMGHEFVHVSQYAALAGQSTSLLSTSVNGLSFKGDLMEFHAYSYQARLGSDALQLNSFSSSDIRLMMQSWPNWFEKMSQLNFNWYGNFVGF